MSQIKIGDRIRKEAPHDGSRRPPLIGPIKTIVGLKSHAPIDGVSQIRDYIVLLDDGTWEFWYNVRVVGK